MNEGQILTQIPETTPNPLHKDTDLGYFAGLAMQGLIGCNTDSEGGWILSREVLAKEAIGQAQELIKQLDEPK